MKFAILIYENVEPIDVGATTGVLSMARRFESNIEFFMVAETKGEVVLSNNVRTIADYSYDDCPDFDLLIVTGGPGWVKQCDNQQTLQFIQSANNKAKLVSVCTGAMILAASGIIRDSQITTRRLAASGEKIPLNMIKDYAPDAKPLTAALVDEGNIITGGGVTLAIDVMFYLLGKFYSPELKQKTAELMEYDRALQANEEHLGLVQ